MIFKTIDNELKVFGKTILTTTEHLKNLETVSATVYNKNGKFTLKGLAVNTSQSVSNFTKLNNAFKVYNNNLNKSTQLQNAYIKAVGNQNNLLGNYLAGLNGTKASMSGYVKSLISAKVATIGLEIASTALNMALSLGVSLAISAIISQISKLITAQEDARKKSLELTNSYKEQKDSLDSQIEKYKELKESLDNGNLSTNEVRSVKEQLLEIQKSLIESYGTEASNLDLVNGKYREQLGLLGDLSKEKANDYITENRDTFSDAKKELEKIRTYNIGNITSWSSISPQTEDQKRLLDYINSYSDLLQLSYGGASHGNYSITTVDLSVKANVENADELMHQLATDLENYGKENNIDVSGLLEGISGQLKKTWTDELSEYKTIYDEFMKAEVVRSDTLRPLYQQSIQAVEDYNNALSSGNGVDEAKAKLDSVKQSVSENTKELEGSETVFDDIFDSINQDAEAAYNLDQAFSNNKTVKDYAEQLKGLSNTDLKAINFDNDNVEKGEEAFKNLMNILGLTKDQAQNLIDKLIELGYVQGELKEQTSNKTPSSFLDIWNSSDFSESKKKLLELAKSGELTSETLKSTADYKKILDETGNSADDTKNKIYELLTAQEKLAGASSGINNLSSAYKEFEEKGFVTAQTIEALPDVFKKLEGYDLFAKIIGNPKNGTDKIKQAFNQIVQEYLNYTKVFNSEDLYSDNLEIQQNAIETYIANLKSIGITNAEEVVNQTVNSVKQQRTLFNEAEQEYINYLNNKDGVTLEYIESTASKNSQLMQSFGEGYQDDYNNWIELLKKKQEAYQALVAALNGEYDPTESIVGNLLKNGKEVTASAIVAGEEARAAYEREMKKYEDYKNSFSLNFTPTNFDASYTSPDGSSSSSSKTDAYKQAFDDWYEALKHQLAMGQITEAQYYKELDKKNKEYFANKKEYLSEYRQYEEEVYKGLRSLQDNALSSIHSLIDLRKEMIKDMKQDEIDAINKVIEKEKKKLEAINESIDARKKAIELLKDERTHDEEIADKNKAISDIQSKIDALKYDNSASAQKKRREFEEELTDAKKELADYITDYEYDKAVDALDKESDAAQKKYDKEEERLQNQIDKIEEYINNQKLLTQDALNDINGLNQSLFEKMKQWALDTKGEVYDVVDAWNEARKALELYNGVNRVPQVHDTLHKNAASQNGVTPIGNLGSKNTNKNNSNTSSGNSNNNSNSGYKAVHTIVKNDTLWVLAQKYYGDGTKWTKIQRANGNINPNNLPIGKKLYIPYKKGTKKVPENQLALTDELGEELILHANEKGTLRNLTKGSSVIPADITENLMSWGNFNPDMFIKNLTPTLPNITSVSNSKANTPTINIGDININGNMGNLTKSDLNNFRKEIVNDVYDNIQKNRVKNGRY